MKHNVLYNSQNYFSAHGFDEGKLLRQDSLYPITINGNLDI